MTHARTPKPSRAVPAPAAPHPIPSLRDLLASQGRVQVLGARGSLAAWLAAGVAEPGHPILWITTSQEAADTAATDLRFFFGDSPRDMAHRPGEGRRRVLLYPDWDVAPYSGLSPHADGVRRRIEALHTLSVDPEIVVVAPATALLKRVLPAAALRDATSHIVVGQELPREAFVARLVEGGYLSTDRTEDRGCFSVRGHVLDVFAPLHAAPLRLESWGDTVDALRAYDPDSQRSIGGPLTRAVVLPLREEILTPAAIGQARAGLERICRERGLLPRHRIALQEQVERGAGFTGMEAYLPLFHEELATFFDHLPEGTLVVVEAPELVADAVHIATDRIETAWKDDLQEEALVPAPETLFLGEAAFGACLAGVRRIDVPAAVAADGVPSLRVDSADLTGLRGEILARRADEDGMLTPFVDRLNAWRRQGMTAVLGCRTRSQVPLLPDALRPYGVPVAAWPDLPGPAAWEATHGPIARAGDALVALPQSPARGFACPAGHLAVVADAELYGRRAAARVVAGASARAAFSTFSELVEGDAVVHSRHGIATFRGLQKLAVGESRNDFLLLEYDGGDRLYLPVHKLDLLTRWVGPPGATPLLDKLGGTTWKARRRKAEEAVQKLARQLLDLYASRSVSARRPYAPGADLYQRFCDAFPYDETEDQLEAVAAIQRDLDADRPMDRLLCGDVGFGKTEVALRAAFRVVENGRQVAVLVPTTILALQHFASFRDRLEGFPVRVAMLSRFVTGAEERKVVEDVSLGRVDVLIGTHRLLQADLRWKDLGLLVVDEEHRFGVRHKERIKDLRRDVDVLAMTATPIPRTLNMAMAGIRDLSLITTPPHGRLAVRTYVARFTPARVRDAIESELRRDGQVFFVHNRVRSIAGVARFLARHVPSARVRVAHGQMAPEQLEGIMAEFVQRRFDVLLCTTIIESGIDIPNANTVIVHRADALGLAQLYQIRGRVGRGRNRGYAWLLVPPGRSVRPEAVERLKALQDHTDLGAGFRVAAHDLEMRGAGDVLGRSQSGHIAAVGFETYMELLEAAVRSLRGERSRDIDFESEVDIACEGYIPQDYVPDQRDRLLYYKRLSTAPGDVEAQRLVDEMEDLFGRVPDPVRRLAHLIRVKVIARKLRIPRMNSVGSGVLVRFDAATPVQPATLARLAAGNPQRLKLDPDGTLTIKLSPEEKKDPLPLVERVLKRLT